MGDKSDTQEFSEASSGYSAGKSTVKKLPEDVQPIKVELADATVTSQVKLKFSRPV